ncbi:MAG: hypothetical protein ACREOF_05265 [Gemmatimonadales bacterium]
MLSAPPASLTSNHTPSWRRVVLLLAIGAGLMAWVFPRSPHRWRLNPRVTDRVGAIPDDTHG